MHLHRIVLLFSFLLFSFSALEAQTIDPTAARAELAKRNIPEEEIERRLAERGININSVDPTDPAALAEVEAAIQEIIAEIEAERSAAGGTDSGSASPGSVAEEAPSGTKRAGNEIEQKVAEDQIKEVQAEVLQTQAEQAELPKAKVYGQELFREYAITQNSSVKPPSNYLIGTGDEIGVAIFGISEASFSFEVNAEGYIQPQGLGRIYLKGLTFKQAEELLRRRFSRSYVFTPGQFALTLNYSREITVNIVGNVERPGAYNISSVNTVIGALTIAGGPSDLGSLRKIKIVSDDQTRTLDVYKFLQDPSPENNVYLNANDYIYVPAFDKQIEIEGAVNRPLIYELTEGENLRELITYSGGLKADAYRGNIQISRTVNDEVKILDVDYRSLLQNGGNFPLFNGDKVNVKTLNRAANNVVTVTGAVAYPGNFELTEGMRVSDLLRRSEILEEAFTDIAYLQRLNTDSTLTYVRLNLSDIMANPSSENDRILAAKDKINIYFSSVRTVEDESNFVVRGAVQNPGLYPFGTGGSLKIEDALQIAGGVRQDAKTDFGYLIRKDPVTSEPEYLRFDLDVVLNNPASETNVPLSPGDTIEIFSTRKFIDESFVEVVGAVRNPSRFAWDASLTLQDVLSLSEGLQLAAARNRVEVFRLILTDNEPTETVVATLEVDEELNVTSGNGDFLLEPFDIIAVRYVPGFDKQEMISLSGEVKFPGTYPLIADNERLSSIIERAGGVTREGFLPGATLFRSDEEVGFVVIKLEEVLKNPNSPYNVILKKGDIITVPKANELVTIKGATEAAELYVDEVTADGKVAVPFLKSKSAREYVNEFAAGFSDDARRGKVTVEHPNGELKRTLDLGLVKIYPKIRPGSVINVPTKPPAKLKEKEEKEPVDWAKVLADSITQATAILSLVLLLQSVNN